MDIMEAIKFVALYGLESIVIALVGVTLIAGVYQLIRDQVLAAREKTRARRASSTETAPEPVKRS